MTSVQRWWGYITTKIGLELEASADPKVQLEQAIAAAREQHQRLTDQAAEVIANERGLEARLDRDIDELRRTNASLVQALRLAAAAREADDVSVAERHELAAEQLASRTISLEEEIEELTSAVQVATQASTRAREAVRQNGMTLQRSLIERERLLGRLDQARMQEQMNAAMRQLAVAQTADAPSVEDVRSKIGRRLASAQAVAEMRDDTIDGALLAIEEAHTRALARERVQAVRAELDRTAEPAASSHASASGRTGAASDAHDPGSKANA